MRFLLLIIPFFLFFTSCSKGGKKNTQVSIALGNIFTGAVPTGGALIYGTTSDGSNRFTLNAIENDTVLLPNGVWKFYAISWDGADNFTGNTKCEVTSPVNLEGGDNTVSMILSAAKCSDPFFVGNSISGSLLPSLNLENCSPEGVVQAVNFSSNCNSYQGRTRSVRLKIVENSSFGAPLTSSLSSSCLNFTPGTSSKSTSLKIPVGSFQNSFKYSLDQFAGKDCKLNQSTIILSQGFSQAETGTAFFDNGTDLKFYSTFKATESMPTWRYSADPLGAVAVGEYAYSIKLASKVLDIYSLAGNSIKLLDSFPLPAFPRAIDKIDSEHIAVAGGDLHIINVKDPLNVYIRKSYAPSAGTAYGISVNGNVGILALGTPGVDIVDLSNLNSPTLLSTYSSTENFRSGDYDPSSQICVFGGPADSNADIVDCSNLSSPTHVGDYTGNTVYGVDVVGNTAYLSCNGPNHIVDISTPSTPSQLSTYLGGTKDMSFVDGNTLHFAGTYYYIYDISTPSSPTSVGQYGPGSGVKWVSPIDADKSLVSLDQGLALVDITTPASPSELDKILNYPVSGKPLAFGNRLIASNMIIDVSSPETPKFHSSFAGNLNYGSTVVGNYVYTLTNPLQVYDFSNPSSPALLGQSGSITNRKDVAVSGSYAYVTRTDFGLEVYDVSTPSSITQVGSLGGFTYAWGVDVSGSHVFIADANANQFVSVDVSNPTSPSQTDSLALTNGRSVQILGNYAYVTKAGGLEIIDISNPASLTSVASLAVGNAIGIDVVGSINRAFIALGTSGVAVVDISNPLSPAHVTTFTGNIYDCDYVKYENGYLYVGDTTAGIAIINVSDPDNPHQ